MAEVRQIIGGGLVLPANREVIRGYLDYVADAPDDLTTIAKLMHAPPTPYIPEARFNELVLWIFMTWTGSKAEGRQALAPLRALAEPVADAIGLIPYPATFNYTAHQAIPVCHFIRHTFAHQVGEAVIDAGFDAVDHASSPFNMVEFRGLGGAMRRVAAEATAFAHREKRYLVSGLAFWMDETEDATPHRSWIDALWPAIRAEGAGAYVNFLEDEGQERIREVYPSATLARLTKVKRTPMTHTTCSVSIRTSFRLCAAKRQTTVEGCCAARGELLRPHSGL